MTKKELTIGSLFAGIGGFDLGFSRQGFKTKWIVEWEPKCQHVLRRHFPEAKVYGDITAVEPEELERVDVITYGFPCFVAGTLVQCEDGSKPIELVKIGDLVLTHMNRYRKVTSLMQRYAPVITLLGDCDLELTTTHEHPFYASAGLVSDESIDPKWVHAKNMLGKYWCSPLKDGCPLAPALSGDNAFHMGNFAFGVVEEIQDEGKFDTVFNISVEEDESYTADGIVVHNCTDVSQAGQRKGLIDEEGKITRSGLFFRATEFILRIRPRVAVFENVPGLLTSIEGADFAAVLTKLADIGYDETVWLGVDSQFFGVAQRRRRVFGISVCASERGVAEGCAGEVLALEESLRWNSPPIRQTGEGSAPTARAGVEGTVGPKATFWNDEDLASTMTSRCHDQFMPDKGNFAAVLDPFSVREAGHGYHVESDMAGTVRARGDDHTSTIVVESVEEPVRTSDRIYINPDVSVTLQSSGGGSGAKSGLYLIEEEVQVFDARGNGDGEVSSTLTGDHQSRVTDYTALAVEKVATRTIVRRLTPDETERLQGFQWQLPDGTWSDSWTDWGIDEMGKKVKLGDSVRYKQTGNAVTVTVAEFLAKLIRKQLDGSSNPT